jgi:nucleoside 2-deoxyribosyltransferase
MIYLAGPINGCTDEECKDWRVQAKFSLGIETVDPMKRDYRGKESTCYREIVELDKRDIRTCDAVLVNFPKPSAGTSMEILYAWEYDIPVCVVIPQAVRISPWVRYHATKIVHRFSDAYEWLQDVHP